MTSSIFKILNELKLDIVVDNLFETTSTENYSKSTYRIKDVRMQNMLFFVLVYI